MTRPRILQYLANLLQHPSKVINPKGNCLSIGDMHGNTKKMLDFLVSHQVIIFDDANDYQALLDIFNQPSWAKEDYVRFAEILARSKVNNDLFVRFMGDNFGDRGRNDFFSLLVLNHLKQNGLHYEILVSNHDLEFINAYENCDISKGYVGKTQFLDDGFCISLLNMAKEVTAGNLTKEQIDELYRTVYLPALRVASCEVVDDEAHIYSHGVIDLEILENAAKDLNVPVGDNTDPNNIREMIDGINKAFLELGRTKQIFKKCDPKVLRSYYENPAYLRRKDKKRWLEAVAWSRVAWLKLNEVLNQTLHFYHAHTGLTGAYVVSYNGKQLYADDNYHNMDDNEVGKSEHGMYQAGKISIAHSTYSPTLDLHAIVIEKYEQEEIITDAIVMPADLNVEVNLNANLVSDPSPAPGLNLDKINSRIDLENFVKNLKTKISLDDKNNLYIKYKDILQKENKGCGFKKYFVPFLMSKITKQQAVDDLLKDQPQKKGTFTQIHRAQQSGLLGKINRIKI